ncbi:beta-lactamase-like protein [Haematococcus lacustris]
MLGIRVSPRPWVSQRTRRDVRVAFMHSENVKNAHAKRPQNTAGDFWVDATCINCDTCRWMSPCFTKVEEQSAVTRQPETHAERVRALQALLSCPTFSIHVDRRTPQELREAQEGLPAPVPGVPGVFHCGWHSVKSFAGTAYLIVRPADQGGNVLVDSPRYNPVLAKRVEEMGGVSCIFLTHRDDVGDHEKWAAHFKAPRILHQGEVNDDTAGVEVKLQGTGPWVLRPGSSPLVVPADQQDQEGAELLMVHTPGHTTDHVVLLQRATRTLFAGDHLSSPEDRHEPATLHVFKDFCWYDLGTQLKSVELLLAYDWVNVLPGHGRMAFLTTIEQRDATARQLLERHGQAKQGVKAEAATAAAL